MCTLIHHAASCWLCGHWPLSVQLLARPASPTLSSEAAVRPQGRALELLSLRVEGTRLKPEMRLSSPPRDSLSRECAYRQTPLLSEPQPEQNRPKQHSVLLTTGMRLPLVNATKRELTSWVVWEDRGPRLSQSCTRLKVGVPTGDHVQCSGSSSCGVLSKGVQP